MIMTSCNLKDAITGSNTSKACAQYHESCHVMFSQLLTPVRCQGAVYASTDWVLTKKREKMRR